MKQRTFTLVAGVIFALVALIHAWRLYGAWPVVINGWTVPLSLSWIGLVIGAGLSYNGFRLYAQRRGSDQLR